MSTRTSASRHLAAAVAAALGLAALDADALSISRLTPPSNLFSVGATASASLPQISRFIPGQRFDVQASVKTAAGESITGVTFAVDGAPIGSTIAAGTVAANQSYVTSGTTGGVAAVVTQRAYSNLSPGIHTLTATVTASDASGNPLSAVTASGSFEIVPINVNGGRKIKNVIILLGDGMGTSHRTAARIVQNGYTNGKANAKLAMDTFPNTALIMTASLDTIITDSAPGMQNYVTGQKSASGQEGVWPDDTSSAFDNPRFEYLSEFLHRTQGKTLGLVTTADVFDATPAANAVHTANRGLGTGIVDQYLDDSSLTGLTVLLGGGRKWFLPNVVDASGNPTGTNAITTNTNVVFNGSARTAAGDYVLPADLVAGWGTAAGSLDPARDLIADFTTAGWTYAPDNTTLAGINGAATPKLLGLFSLSNMNIALDKLNGRRGTSTVVNDYGFPDQPLLPDMAQKALDVLDTHSPNGFVLMVEGASIDKQAHLMDTSRWIDDTIEFDKAVAVAKSYAATHADTLVIVTADHECAGAVIIGTSKLTDANLTTTIASKGNTNEATGAAYEGPSLFTPALRNAVVANYNGNPVTNFPKYTLNADGYPDSMDPDYKLLIGYGSGADHYEDYKTRAKPTNDSQQPGNNVTPLSNYPRNNYTDGTFATGTRPLQQSAGWWVTGYSPGDQAVHTGGDIPLSAYGRGAGLFGGTIDNTDVFFQLSQATVGGTTK